MSHLAKSKVSSEDDPLSIFGFSSPSLPSSSSSSAFLTPSPPSSSSSTNIINEDLHSLNEDLFKDFDNKDQFQEFNIKHLDQYSWVFSFDTLFGTSLASSSNFSSSISTNQQRLLLRYIWQQRSSSFSDTPPSQLRGLLWRYFFDLISPTDTSAWGEDMKDMVKDYNKIKEKVRPNIAKSEIDPLSALSQGLEPWEDYDKIVELNNIIEKDLDRLYLTGMDDLISYDDYLEENKEKGIIDNDTKKSLWDNTKKSYELNFIIKEFFQQSNNREILHNILFTWCMKDENLFLGYRQGMHELIGIIFLILYQEQLNFFSLGLEIMKKKYQLIFKTIQELKIENENLSTDDIDLIDLDELTKLYNLSDIIGEKSEINQIKIEDLDEKFFSICENLFSFFQPSNISTPSSLSKITKADNLMSDFLFSPSNPNILEYYKELFSVKVDKKNETFNKKLLQKLSQNKIYNKMNKILSHFFSIFTPSEFLLRIEAHTFYLFSKLMKEMLPLYDTQGVTIDHELWEKGEKIPYADGDYSNTNPQPFIVHYSSYIQYEFLPLFDRNVYNYLKECQIPSQVYALRWLRLLFSREFDVIEFKNGEYITNKSKIIDKNESLLSDYNKNTLKMKNDFSFSPYTFFNFPSVEGILIKIWDIIFASYFEYKHFSIDLVKNSIDKNDYYSLFLQACAKEAKLTKPMNQDDDSEFLSPSTSSSILSSVPFFKFVSPNAQSEPYEITPFIGSIGDVMLSMLLYLETSFYPNKDYSLIPDSSVAYMCLMKYPPFSLYSSSENNVNDQGVEYQNFNDLWESINMIHRGVFVIKDSLHGNILNYSSSSSLSNSPAGYSTFSISNSSIPSNINSNFLSTSSKISSNIFSTLAEVNYNSKKFLSNFKNKVNNSLLILSPTEFANNRKLRMKSSNWDDDDEEDDSSEESDEDDNTKDHYSVKTKKNGSTSTNYSTSTQTKELSPSTNTDSFTSPYSSSSSASSSVFNSSSSSSSTFFSNASKFNLFGSSSSSYDSSVFSTPPSSTPPTSSNNIDIAKPFNILASQFKNLTTTVTSTFSSKNDNESELTNITSTTPLDPNPVSQPSDAALKEKRRVSNTFGDWDYISNNSI